MSRGNTGIDPNQWNFKAYYLYGAVAPQTGESFWLEFSHLDDGSDKYVVIKYSLAQNIVVMMDKIPNSTHMVF